MTKELLEALADLTWAMRRSRSAWRRDAVVMASVDRAEALIVKVSEYIDTIKTEPVDFP